MTARWEMVCKESVEVDGHRSELSRIRVVGGWLYRYYEPAGDEIEEPKIVTTTFVPDAPDIYPPHSDNGNTPQDQTVDRLEAALS